MVSCALSALLLLYCSLHEFANERWSRYHLIRHLFVMAIAIRSIELTIQRNSISEVQSLNSTGQIMPLAIGVATVLSLLYMWVRDFVRGGRVSAISGVHLGSLCTYISLVGEYFWSDARYCGAADWVSDGIG